MPDYDAFLLVSFGGPEGPADVVPFLENVTRGRGVPRDRLAKVARHYDLFGGVSPINQQCRDLLTAIGKDFAAAGIDLPRYWGNRNWHPYLADTVAQMTADGVRHAIAFVTSAYGSHSSCRQYLDDIETARAQAGPGAPRIDKIRHFFNHPGFIGSVTEAALAAIGQLPEFVRHDAWLVFTAHSIPEAMAAASGPAGGLYPAQLAEAARLVAEQVAGAEGHERSWCLAYQSRSGPPSVPWPARTSATSSPNWPATAPRPWWSSRSASSPTTSRSCSTWTSRRRSGRATSACLWPGRPPRAPIPGSSP